MFNGKRIANIEKRLLELETRMNNHVHYTFTIWSEKEKTLVDRDFSVGYEHASHEILVKDVVLRILEHMGMKLTYVAGIPTRVEIEKIEKKADTKKS